MKITKHGKFFNKIFFGVCPKCECKFNTEYRTDIYIDFPINEDGEEEIEGKPHILCPECGFRVMLTTKEIKK